HLTCSPAISVAAPHLDLACGPQVAERLVATTLSELAGQPVCQRYRQRHQLGRLIAREAEHHPGVAGAAHIDALRDVGRLLVDADDDAAGLGIKTVLGPRVADVPDGLADDARDIDVAVGGDLPDHHHQARGHD